MNELRECPFCGGEAHIAERLTYGGKMYGVSCSTPLCPGSEPWPWCMNSEDAVKSWNTRSERTCHMIDNGCELCCSECDARHEYDLEPNYCYNCGAKVITDGDR